ncbi:hypothetical protein [Rubrivirga sp. IMCC45206]|uniref:hypothetical protein n=1 Tax=Rubrivirga sp. IMCC45206 TaxID=3391614 RepID=UPI00398FCDC1
MADDSKKPAPDTDLAPGVPDPNPTVPDASTEPAAQAVAETAATVAPPPSLDEMPDDYATDDPVATAKAWIDANPGMAVLAAAGVGLLAGRLLTSLFPSPQPPSLSDRVEKRARQLSKSAKKQSKALRSDARGYVGDSGDALQDSLHRAAEALREAASTAGDVAGDGYERTKDFAETMADAAKVAITGVMATKIDDWVKKVRD